LSAINGLELFGHERGNIEVFKAVRDLGAEVCVGLNTRNAGGDVGSHLRRYGFSTFLIPFGPQWSIRWLRKHPRLLFENPWRTIKSSWVFYQQIARFKPTHIHLGSPLGYSFISLALVDTKIPLIYRMGDCPPTDSPFNLLIWKQMLWRTTVAVANSQFVADRVYAATRRPLSIRVLHNLAPSESDHAVVTDEGPLSIERAGEFRILYVGSVSAHKGVSVLVRAFAAICRTRGNLRLWIVGGSMYDQEFREALSREIDSLGVRKITDLAGYSPVPEKWYRRASIHIAPSLWEEPSANVVLEAKREGIPSVVFPSGGLPEMVRHKIDGYICKDKTPEALATGIRWMLADPMRLREMGRAAQADSETRFGRKRFLEQWAEVYGSTLTGAVAGSS
jgi:glycosyltransferase involved in cell wall biosynthesis